MQTKIPLIKYRSKDSANLHFGIIEINGEVIHRIEDLEAFYKIFGYTDDLVKTGKLPDDFIWEAYVTNSAVNCAPCFQLHIIEYLIMHSTAFLKKNIGNNTMTGLLPMHKLGLQTAIYVTSAKQSGERKVFPLRISLLNYR